MYKQMNYSRIFCAFALCFMVLTFCDPVMAASDLGGMADKLKGGLEKVIPLVKVGLVLGGLFLLGTGFFSLYNASKTGQPKGGAFAAIGVGIALVALTGLLSAATGSLGLTVDTRVGQ